MERISVESSNIKSIGYDSGREVLEVSFNNGGVYHYHGVSYQTYQELMSADSKGKKRFRSLIDGMIFSIPVITM